MVTLQHKPVPPGHIHLLGNVIAKDSHSALEITANHVPINKVFWLHSILIRKLLFCACDKPPSWVMTMEISCKYNDYRQSIHIALIKGKKYLPLMYKKWVVYFQRWCGESFFSQGRFRHNSRMKEMLHDWEVSVQSVGPRWLTEPGDDCMGRHLVLKGSPRFPPLWLARPKVQALALPQWRDHTNRWLGRGWHWQPYLETAVSLARAVPVLPWHGIFIYGNGATNAGQGRQTHVYWTSLESLLDYRSIDTRVRRSGRVYCCRVIFLASCCNLK